MCRNKGSIEISKKLLGSGTPLKNLILSGNEIGYNSAKQIIDRVKRITTIEQLNLSLNCFGSQYADLQQDEERYKFLDMGEERFAFLIITLNKYIFTSRTFFKNL